ncbi:MAG: efflux RND transporter permease subunit [Aureliella sp.]
MQPLFYWLAHKSVQHRFVVGMIISLISGVSLLGYFRPNWMQIDVWDTERGNSRVEREVDEEPNVSPISLSNSDVVLVLEAENFFTNPMIRALRASVADLEALDQVGGVLWIDRVPILNIFGLPEPLLPRTDSSDLRLKKSRSKALEHPLVGGQLLSSDGKTMLLMVTLNYFHVHDDADATTLLTKTLRESLAENGAVNFRVRATGRVPSALAAISRHEANQLRYQLFGYGMILLMSLILFRGIRAVVIVALAPTLGVFWTLGCIRFFNYNNNPLIDVILPVLVSLVGLTDGVHLMVQIRKLRAQGISKLESAEQGLRQVGIACFLTSLTTAIGFGSLMLADSLWVQQFGFCSMLGVLLCFIAVVTVIPFACSSRFANGMEAGQQNSFVDKNLNKIGFLIGGILNRRRPVAFLGVVLTLVCLACSLTLRPDQRESDSLPESAESTQALFHVDRAFGGLEFSTIEILWEPSVDRDSPEILEVVNKVDQVLSQEKLIGHPLSIKNLIDAQPGSGPPEERITLLELLPPPLKRAFYSPERRRTIANFRVQDVGIAAYGPVFERIEAALIEIENQHPEFALSLTGRAAWRWRNLYQIVVDLALSLGSASVIIWIVLTCVFRSMRLGLISIIPNLFPLALTGTYLALAGYNLEIVMVCNFTVCLGIAVDDTIHFMTRYLDERDSASNNVEAIRSAFTGVGTALIMTTTVLVAGFGVVIFSDSRDHHIFAVMGAITVAAALFCDLVFLPALLAVFGGEKRDSEF